MNAPAPKVFQRRGARPVLYAVTVALLWVLLVRACHSVANAPPGVVWDSSQAGPPPRSFHFIGFPASEGVPLFDVPQGGEVGTLDRAVGLMIDEEGGEWAGVTGTTHRAVRRSDLVLMPPPGSEELLRAYERNMRSRLAGEFLGARLETSGDLQAPVFTFVQRFDDWTHYSTYRVRDGRGEPIRFARRGINDGFALGISAILTGLVGCLATFWLRRAVWAGAATPLS